MDAGRIQSDYNESFYFLNERKQRQVKQLVLLNNLNRGDQNIASTLLLTLFDRLMSASYDDRMQVKFMPSQGINQQQINAYNTLAQSDYQEMEKAKMDYDWVWDTLFFGRGYTETIRFDKKRKIMQPHVINPLVFFYDPYFTEPQTWRYYAKWLTKDKWELMKLIDAGIITGVESIDQIPDGVDPYLWDYKVKRDEAKKVVQPPIQPAGSGVYQILEYYGYDDDGNKTVYWVDKDFSHILLEQKLDLKDGEPIIAPDGKQLETDSKWPIVVKEAFREPHSSVNFSVADVLEDKHRAKSVLLNLAYIAAKDQANPLYWYDPDKVKDVSQFLSRQVNQHIPVEGDGNMAVGPLNKASAMSPELTAFISVLTQEANEPMGTGMVMQPLPGKKETATEAAITQQMNDMAQSLISKVMQFGEKEFWGHWFARYAQHAGSLGSKVANIVGVKGVETTEIDMSMFNTKFPPGVFVYSAKEAEYKEMIVRRDLMQLYPELVNTLGPDGMRNFNKHVFFPKFIQDPSLIDVMLPKTLDEIKAEAENEMLLNNELPNASPSDNHETHIYIHMTVNPKTWATWFHIRQHEDMLAEQKAQQQAQQMMAAPGMGAKAPPQQMNPAQASVPNQQMMESSQPMNKNATKGQPIKQLTNKENG